MPQFKKNDNVRTLNVWGIPNTARFIVVNVTDGNRYTDITAKKKNLAYNKGGELIKQVKVRIRLKEDCRHLTKGKEFELTEGCLIKC